MEFLTNFERKSTCPLFGQLERQDEYCDITIKCGTWTKRFHRCVLAESIFFKTLFGQKEFLENQTGIVHIQIGDQDTLEQALMFLYDINPTLTMDNISIMLELAEFLFISTLKSFCVKWLNKLTITEHNFWLVLSLGSLYDFSVPSLDMYIDEHLVELMSKTEMLKIDNHSVDFILTNKQLSYIGMDLKFDFLMRWTKHDAGKRLKYFDDLLCHIDLIQLSDSMIEKAKCDKFFKYSYMLPEHSIRLVDRFIAIIFKVNVSNVNTDLMIVFDEHSQEWHKVESQTSCAFECEYYYDMSDDETIYHVVHDINGTIECIKPECNTRATTRLVYSCETEKADLTLGVTNKLCFSKGICYQINYKKTKVMKQVSPPGHILVDDSTNVPLDLRTYRSTREFKACYLYVGNMSTINGCTSLTPVLSTFNFDVIWLSCWNNHVAMLSEYDDYLLLYDTTTCRLSQMNCDLGIYRKINSFSEGFLVFDHQKVICIMKGPHDDAFQSVSVDLFNEPFYDRFRTFNDSRNMYIYKHDDNNDIFVLGIANIMETFTFPKQTITWKFIPVLDININSVISIMSVKIPTTNARCHLLCPCLQCKKISRGVKRKRSQQWSFGLWSDSENSNDEYSSAEDTSEDESD